jgi:hypothetical protein
MIRIGAVILSLLVFSGVSRAQVTVNGTVDVALESGGNSSKFITNGINEEYKYLHVSIPQVNLLLFAPINDHWYFEARLQSDTWGTGELSDPRFTLVNLTWADPDRNSLLSFGRFTSPVGVYSKKGLSIDRTFIDLPLNYSYFTNISDERGFWPNAGVSGNYTTGDVGLTTIYFGGYTTGILWDWIIDENKLKLQTSLSMVAPASDQNYTNLANAALLTHLTYNPSIFWEIGVSASHGSFMQRTSVNNVYRPQNPLEQYRQSLIGVDLRYASGYWEIQAETIFSFWTAPCYRDGQFVLYENDQLAEYRNTNIGSNIDIKFEPPFLPGSYFALRADHLNFLTAETDRSTLSSDWDEDTTRFTGVFGYKLNRNVVAKISFSEQTPFDTSLYTFRAQLTAFF